MLRGMPSGRAPRSTVAACSCAISSLLGVADAWIDDAIEEVDHDVDEDDEGRDDQHERLYDGHVARLDGNDELAAHPGDAEEVFEDHVPAQERGDRESDDGE